MIPYWWRSVRIWPVGAGVGTLVGSKLLQAQGRAVEEKSTASQQLLLHGCQAAPLLNESQHLQGRGESRDNSLYAQFQFEAAGAFIFIANWCLGCRELFLKAKHFLIFEAAPRAQNKQFKLRPFSRQPNKTHQSKGEMCIRLAKQSIQRKSSENEANRTLVTKVNGQFTNIYYTWEVFIFMNDAHCQKMTFLGCFCSLWGAVW